MTFWRRRRLGDNLNLRGGGRQTMKDTLEIIHTLLQNPTIPEETKIFFRGLVEDPEKIERMYRLLCENRELLSFATIVAEFVEVLGREEAMGILNSLCSAKSKEETFNVLVELDEKMKLYLAECEGEA